MSGAISRLTFGLSRLNPVYTGTLGAITLSGAVAGGDQTWTNVGDMTFAAGSILASGSTNGNTLLFRANDTTLMTFTTGATDTLDIGVHNISGDVTVTTAKVFKPATATAAEYFDFQVADTDTSVMTTVMRFINDDKPGVLCPAKLVVGSSDVATFDRGAFTVVGTTELQGDLNINGAYGIAVNTSAYGITTSAAACKFCELKHSVINTTTSTEYSWRFKVYDEEVLRVAGTATGANTLNDASCYALFSHDAEFATTMGIRTSTTDSTYLVFKATDDDGAALAQLEIARMVSANDPYFQFGGSGQFQFYNSGYETVGTSGAPLTLTVGTPFFSLYSTTADAGTGNAEPFYVKNTLTGAGAYGGRSRFDLVVNAAAGNYVNALKAYTSFGASGRVTGMASALCAELALSAGTTPGSYAALEAELVAATGDPVGASTSFLYCNAGGTGSTTVIDAQASLFYFGPQLSAGANGFIDTDITAVTAYGGIRCKMPDGSIKYLLLVSA